VCRFYSYDMLLRLGGGVLLVLYDELKSHGAKGLMQQGRKGWGPPPPA
jgi:solute carrier family 25 (adenine nucleotide translocator) protein 4/5/6/31